MAFHDLLKDAVFVDYFNVFLSLPVRHVVFVIFILTVADIINCIC